MKKIMFFLIVGAIFCQSQTQRVVQVPFTYNGSQNNYINANDTKWQINQFQFGWHWGGNKSINKALGFNQSHSTMNSAIDFTNNTNITYVDKGKLGGDCRVGSYTNAIAVEWEAALKINEQELGLVQDIKDANNNIIMDREKPVFGFMNQIGTVASETVNNQTNAVLKLNTNLVSDPQNPPIVLSNNWPNNNIRKNQIIIDPKDAPWEMSIAKQREHFGYEFYLSIHIRRDDLNDNLQNSNAVLEIKLPYYPKNAPGSYIIFSELPFDNPTEFEIHNNKGRRQKRYKPDPLDNALRITKNMLPLNNEYITINAFFECNGLKEDIYPNDTLIEPEINIEVKYLGNCNIAIDWIRIESPIAHKLFWGDYNAEIITEVQNVINQYEDNSFVSKDVFLKRIYLRDEAHFEYWKATKYFNELVGNIGTYAMGALMPRLFERYVNPPEFWVEMYSKHGWIAQPYTRYGYNGLLRGFLYPPITQIDSLKSHYETYLSNNQSFLTTLSNQYKGDVTSNIHDWGASMKCWDEYALRQFNKYTPSDFSNEYIVDMLQSNNYLFSEKKWIGQIFLDTQWGKIENTTYAPTVLQSSHSELLKMNCFRNILYGAKGLLFDGDIGQITYIIQTKLFSNLDIINEKKLLDDRYDADSPNFDSNVFLNDDDLGRDFIDGDYIIKGAISINLNDPSIFDKIGFQQSANVKSTRMHIGSKSNRLLLKEINNYVKANEDDLMKLKLVSFINKGFTWNYNQDPSIETDDVMSQFVHLGREYWKTRPLNRVKDGEPYYENETEEDSSFYSVTMLKHSDNPEMDDIFYIGVANERTDPLIYINNQIDVNEPNSHLLFLTTAEFNELCLNGGNNPESNVYKSASEWQSYKYKQLGAREITIPFNYKRTANDKFCLLRVTELAGMDSTIGTWQFRHNVDTVIAQDASISVNFLPGEGKLFRIEIIEPDSVNGYLAHSNQTKMVAHNELDASGSETENIRYHLVYHKPDPERNNLSTVYYVRSQVVSPSDKNKQIIWEQPIKVSNTVFQYQQVSPPEILTAVNLDCYYPSLTVRKVGNGLKAFIVYQAKLPYIGICLLPCIIQCSGLKNPIIETQLDLDEDNILLPITSEVIVPYVNGDNQDIFINPVISSAANGNYYAWADSSCGIGIGFKPITVNGPLTTKKYIKAEYTGNAYKNAYHPSLNPYMNENDSEVPLVWEQEFFNTNSNKNINYTILKIDQSGNITNYVQPNLLNQNPVAVNLTNSIWELETANCLNTFPVVQRTYDVNNNMYHDNILWNSNGVFHSSIVRRNIIKWNDFAFVFNKSKIFEGVKIFFPIPFLIIANHVNVAQSSSIKYTNNERTNKINNYISIDYDIYNSLTFFDGIKSLVLNQNSMLTNSNFKYNTPIFLTSTNLKGRYPQLSKSFSPSGNDTWKNRRVNELPREPFPLIVENAKTFLRTSEEEAIPDAMFGYESYRTKLFIDLPKLDDEYLSINLPYTEITDSIYGTIVLESESDTIYSDWFTVGSSANLIMKVETQDTTFTKLAIQKQSDSTYQTLGLPSIGSMFEYLGVLYYILVNGQNEQYRLCLINLDTAARYEERYYVNGLPLQDTVELSKKNDMEKNNFKFVALNPISKNENIQINIYPNPADEKIYVSAYLPIEYIKSNNLENNQLTLSIVNSIGSEIYNSEIAAGETKAIETNTYSNGIYFVKISFNNGASSIAPIQTKMFVIKR